MVISYYYDVLVFIVVMYRLLICVLTIQIMSKIYMIRNKKSNQLSLICYRIRVISIIVMIK